MVKKSNNPPKRKIRNEGSFLRAVGAVVWKDILAEYRSLELISAMTVFSLLVIIIFNFALDLDYKMRQSITAGVLWTTFAFAMDYLCLRRYAWLKSIHVCGKRSRLPGRIIIGSR